MIKGAGKGDNRKYAGVALETHITGSTSTAADDSIEVQISGTFCFVKKAGLLKSHIGNKAYVDDDETITHSATGAAACGWITNVDDDGVWVRLDPNVMYAGA